MKYKTIEKLLETMSKQRPNTRKGDLWQNPYTSKALRENFLKYYHAISSQKGERILLVGEAPSHRGCVKCGIPFCSWEVLGRNTPFINALNLKDPNRVSEYEISARHVWDTIQDMDSIPLLWNAFPFHPYKKGDKNTNRRPCSCEVKIGREYLNAIIEIYKPTKIGAIGRVAERSLKEVDPDISYLRHPSYNGQDLFKKHLNILLIRQNKISLLSTN